VPRNSISRRVARAASIGGSRSYRQRTPIGWYSILLAVCIIGLGLIVFSRHERQVRVANSSTTTSTTQANTTPPLLSDHWQVGLSVDVCGTVANLPRSADQTSGIITDGKGVVDIQPARAGKKASQFEGSKATLGKFLTAEGVKLTATSLELPKSAGKIAGTYANGRKCGSKPGVVQLLIWNPPSWQSSYSAVVSSGSNYAQGELFMLAFLPKGEAAPKPTAAKTVEAFYKVATTPTTVKVGTTTTTTKPGGSTTTTKPGGSTTTTKPGGSTTTSTTAGSSTTTSTTAGSSTTTTAG
jgi:hypothetical protein